MPSCRFCERLEDPSAIPGGPIYEDDLVHASHYMDDETEYLGYLVVQTKRHAAGLAELTDEEAQDVGLTATRLARALKAVVGAEKVYSYVFGEKVPHFHCLVVARYRDVPEEYWRLKLGDWPEAPRGNAEAVAELARRIRRTLESASYRA